MLGHRSRTNGELAGDTVADLRARWAASSRKSRSAAHFSRLDEDHTAHDWLSVQVHPDDAYAQRVEHQPFGKTNAGTSSRLSPNSKIVYGWTRNTSREEYLQRVADGTFGELLRHIELKAGDTVLHTAWIGSCDRAGGDGLRNPAGFGLDVPDVRLQPTRARRQTTRTQRPKGRGRLGLRATTTERFADSLSLRRPRADRANSGRHFVVERIVAGVKPHRWRRRRPLIIMSLVEPLSVASRRRVVALTPYQTVLIPAASQWCTVRRPKGDAAPFMFVTPPQSANSSRPADGRGHRQDASIASWSNSDGISLAGRWLAPGTSPRAAPEPPLGAIPAAGLAKDLRDAVARHRSRRRRRRRCHVRRSAAAHGARRIVRRQSLRDDEFLRHLAGHPSASTSVRSASSSLPNALVCPRRITLHGAGKVTRSCSCLADGRHDRRRRHRRARPSRSSPERPRANVMLRLNVGIEAEYPRIRAHGRRRHEVRHSSSRGSRPPRYQKKSATALRGLARALGSQIYQSGAYSRNVPALVEAAARFAREGLTLEQIVIGGGFGVPSPPGPSQSDSRSKPR